MRMAWRSFRMQAGQVIQLTPDGGDFSARLKDYPATAFSRPILAVSSGQFIVHRITKFRSTFMSQPLPASSFLSGSGQLPAALDAGHE